MTTTSVSVYYHHDGLGNTIAITNGNAEVLERYSYDVFGRVTIVDALTGNSIPQSAHGVRHFYTGHDFQAELGLYLTHYRTYEPALGRWLSADPIGENGGWNLYGYVGNHNTMLTDPLGLAGWVTINSSGNGGSSMTSGHSWISYTPDGGSTTTYGTWGNNPTGHGNGLFENLEAGRTGDASRACPENS
jgi:RHS repeat-associated protein